MFLGIRLKLSLLTFLLVTLVITVSSVIVMGIMDRFLLAELVKRGVSLSRAAANTAGYSMLAHDRLSLENLVAKLKERQSDIIYLAVVDHRGTVVAHTDLKKNGHRFQDQAGTIVNKDSDGSVVTRVTVDGRISYEFNTPITFAGRKIGNFFLGIDAASLTTAQATARNKVIAMSVIILALSIAGTCYIARTFTLPVKKLNDGVDLLRSGSYEGTLTVNQRDELGQLARNFNDMATVILNQQEKLAEYAKGLEESYFATVKILATSIDARDDYTLQHSTRVAALSMLMAEELGMGVVEQRELEVAALVHDLGKIRVPDHILKKAAPLDDHEFERIKRHPRDGADILNNSKALRKFIPAVLHHHEWHNGKGYPDGLSGDQIPLFAAIISLADTYDAMTSFRPYRAGLPPEIAIEEILRCRGTQFNPQLADCFVASLQRLDNHPRLLSILEVPDLQDPDPIAPATEVLA